MAIWAGLAALVAILGIGGGLLLGQPWSEGDGSGSDDSGTTDWGEPVSGIAGTARVEGPVTADSIEFVDTGQWCDQGGRLNISASGEISTSASETGIGPGGLPGGDSPDTRILEDVPTAALIGKLEDTEEPAFEIGEGISYECPVPGSLFLSINDTSTDDNEGEFRVVVTYVPPQE